MYHQIGISSNEQHSNSTTGQICVSAYSGTQTPIMSILLEIYNVKKKKYIINSK